MLHAPQASAVRWAEIEQGHAVDIMLDLAMERDTELGAFDIGEVADED